MTRRLTLGRREFVAVPTLAAIRCLAVITVSSFTFYLTVSC